MKKPKNPHPIHTPKKVEAWEWALVYPLFWLIIYVIGPFVDGLPMRERGYPKDTYRGGI